MLKAATKKLRKILLFASILWVLLAIVTICILRMGVTDLPLKELAGSSIKLPRGTENSRLHIDVSLFGEVYRTYFTLLPEQGEDFMASLECDSTQSFEENERSFYTRYWQYWWWLPSPESKGQNCTIKKDNCSILIRIQRDSPCYRVYVLKWSPLSRPKIVKVKVVLLSESKI